MVRCSLGALLAALALTALTPLPATGQVATWELSGTIDSSQPFPVTSTAANVSASALTLTPNLDPGATFTDAFMGANWPVVDPTPDLSKYFEFSVTAAPGYEVTYSTVEFSLYNNTAGMSGWQLRSSVDGFGQSLDSGLESGITGGGAPFAADVSVLGARPGTVVFRFYCFDNVGVQNPDQRGFRGSAGGGDDLKVYGAISAVDHIAVWELNGTIDSGSDLPLPDYTAANATGSALFKTFHLDPEVAQDAYLTSDWPATGRQTNRYVEFGVGAAGGFGLDLRELWLSLYNEPSGNSSWEIRSSEDNYQAALASGTETNIGGPGAPLVIDLNSLADLTSINFRFYTFQNSGSTARGLRGMAAGGLGIQVFGSVIEMPFRDVTPPGLRLSLDTTFNGTWVDLEGDNYHDLFVGTLNGNQLFDNFVRNFSNVEMEPVSGPNAATQGHSFGDMDNDGDLDLVVTYGGALAEMYRNDGSFTFAEVLPGTWPPSLCADWGDYDGDGDLDVYFGQGVTNQLFRNDAGGTSFVDVTTVTLQGNPVQTPHADWADYDADGDPDLYLASLGANQLLRNDAGVFTDVTSGPLGSLLQTRNAAWADYDGDGDLDLYLSNFNGNNALLRNDGQDSFVDVTDPLLLHGSSTRGATWGDIDEDGDLDLLSTCFGCPNRLFRQDPGNTWGEISSVPLNAASDMTRGVGLGDYDRDGNLDVFLANGSAAQDNLLLENLIGSLDHLQVRLVGLATNRAGLGAQIELWQSGVRQMREVGTGNGADMGNAITTHFGTGGVTVDSLVVRWPSGRRSVVTETGTGEAKRRDLQVPDRLTVVEPPANESIYEALAMDFSDGGVHRVDLATGVIELIAAGAGTDAVTPRLTAGPDRDTVYSLETNGEFGILDLATGTWAEQFLTTPGIGAQGSVEGVVYDPVRERVLTWVNDLVITYLIEIDPATAVGRSRGTFNFTTTVDGAIQAMAIAPDGYLYLLTPETNPGDALWRVNPNTLEAIQVAETDVATEGATDMAFLGADLWLMRDGVTYRIDALTGALLGTVDLLDGTLTGLSRRVCVPADTPLAVSDEPFDAGQQIRLDWSAYDAPPGVTQYEILRSLESCDLFDPALAPVATVPALQTSYLDVTTDFTAFYYGIRVVGASKAASPVVLAAGPVVAKPSLVINEFAPAGGVSKTGQAHRQVGEFVELLNLSGAPIDLTGFRLSNGPGLPSPDEEFLPSVILPDGGFQVIFLSAIDLPDEGGTLSLLPPPDTGGFAFDIVSYGSQGGAPTVPIGFTVNRVPGTDAGDPDVQSFEADEPTTGLENTVPPPALGASLVFNEILYTETETDYVELYNRQATTVFLDQIVLSDGISFFDTLTVNLELGPGEIALLNQGDPGSFTANIQSNLLYLYKVTTQGSLQRIDQLGWGGGPVPSPAPDDALLRIPDGAAVYQGNQGANWADGGGDQTLMYGPRTPGQVNQDPSVLQAFVDPGGGGDYFTITDALADAEVGALPLGTRIFVADGIYAERMTLVDGYEVVGASGTPETVRIVGDGTGPIVTADGVGPATRLIGVTLAGNSGFEGAALSVGLSGAPVMRQLRFENNKANLPTGRGGAVIVHSGNPLFEGCLFVGNASDADGGAVAVVGGLATFRDCLFVENTAEQNGSAIYADGGDVVVEHSIFDRNAAYGNGAGAVQSNVGSIDVTYSTITFDLAGAALASKSSASPTVTFGCGALFGQGAPLGTGILLQEVVAQDPLFCQPLAFNYAYSDESPLVTGLPACSEIIGMTGPPCGSPATHAPVSEVPARTGLLQAVPNPFNPATRLRFELARPGVVEIRLFDARGRWVADVVSRQQMKAGMHDARWIGLDHRGRNVASGVYFARMRLDDEAVGNVQRLVLLK